MSRRSTYHRARRAAPSPLRTLAAALLAVAVLALCATVAEIALWVDAHPAVVIVLGMTLAAVLAVRQSRQAMRGKAKLNVPVMSMPSTVPRYEHRSRSARPPARSPRCAVGPSNRQIVYWEGQRVGTLDKQGRFVPDVRDRRA